jgi:PhnB protein
MAGTMVAMTDVTDGSAFVPDGCLAVTPWLIADGVPALLGFLAEVFGAQETVRMTDPDSARVVHAETLIHGVPVMLFDSADGWPATPAFLRVYVRDVDDTVRRAVAAGAVVVTAPTTLWIGDRAARIRDPWDNLWWLHARVAEPSPDELAAGPPGAAAEAAMTYFGDSLQQEMLRRGRRTG